MSITRQTRRRDEKGAVLVTLALCLTMLMVFSAFVIDIGATYLERRQDQAAADAGALAGASKFLQFTTVANKDVIGRDAVEVARLNMAVPPTVAAWNDAFVGCTDTTRNMTLFPAGSNYNVILSDGRVTDCVHFNRTFTQIRVRIPDRLVSTTFARVIGVNSLSTSAAAEAQVIPNGLRSIPFAIKNGEGNPEDLLCVRLDRDCQGPTNQGTRILDAPYFGNPQLNTTLSCGSMWSPPGDANPGSDGTFGTRAANNAAVGLDHTIVVRITGQPRRSDDCGAAGSLTPTALPNWVYSVEFDNLAGNLPAAAQSFINGIANGLIWGGTYSDGGPPRLQRYPGGWQTRIITHGSNYAVDDRPLWDYIRPGAANIPATCARATFNADPSIQHMVDCLTAWNPGHSPLFDIDSNGDGRYDIQDAPRAGVFPITGTPGGTSWPPSPVTGFETGFLQTMYFSAITNCPCTEYNPGDDPLDNPVNVTGKNLVGMAVFRIQDGMLPDRARPQPTQILPGSLALSK